MRAARRESGFVQGFHIAFFTAIYAMLGFGLWAGGWPPAAGGLYLVAVVGAAVAGCVPAMLALAPDDMGAGCLMVCLAEIAAVLGGGLAARWAAGGSPWASLGGALGGLLTLSLAGAVVRRMWSPRAG